MGNNHDLRRIASGDSTTSDFRSLKSSSTEKNWLNSKSAAQYLDVSPGMIRNLVHRGILPRFYLAGRLRFKRSDLDRAIGTSKKGGY